MSFYRRLRLYIMGFLLGCLLVSFLFKGKSCRLPGTLKMEELRYQKLKYSDYAYCRMKCQNISKDEIVQILITGSINYDQSQVHSKPCPTYAVEGLTKEGHEMQIVFADCDSVTKVVEAVELKLKSQNSQNDSCNCKGR